MKVRYIGPLLASAAASVVAAVCFAADSSPLIDNQFAGAGLGALGLYYFYRLARELLSDLGDWRERKLGRGNGTTTRDRLQAIADRQDRSAAVAVDQTSREETIGREHIRELTTRLDRIVELLQGRENYFVGINLRLDAVDSHVRDCQERLAVIETKGWRKG
jgi:hypothetical protein